MRVLIAPDKFKGSLTAPQAAAAIRRGFERACAAAEFREIPIADGGEGTAEVIHHALGGEWIEAEARDPLGRRVTARYLWLEDAAIIEMSAASGHWRLRPGEFDPTRATTFGTGELILDAAKRGAAKIIVGLGGSATNDGGVGLAAALGFRFLTSDGDPLEPAPDSLLALQCIKAPETLRLPSVIAWCDVRNPLLGERGATRVYGRQKGATPKTIPILEASLEQLADIAAQDLGRDFREVPGAGAAGGLGFGLLTFCDAELRRGFDTLAELTRIDEAVAWSDVVITGEGCIDAQTAEGKAPAALAGLARRQRKRVIAFAGQIAAAEIARELFHEAYAISPAEMPVEVACARAAELLEAAVANSGGLF